MKKGRADDIIECRKKKKQIRTYPTRLDERPLHAQL